MYMVTGVAGSAWGIAALKFCRLWVFVGWVSCHGAATRCRFLRLQGKGRQCHMCAVWEGCCHGMAWSMVHALLDGIPTHCSDLAFCSADSCHRN